MQYFDYYEMEDGTIDKELTLNSEGFALLSDMLEGIVEKLTGEDDIVCPDHNELCEIRFDIMDLATKIARRKYANN